MADRQFVFFLVKDSEGSFTMRVVRLGAGIKGFYAVLAGLKANDEVVTDSSFIVKAEGALRDSILNCNERRSTTGLSTRRSVVVEVSFCGSVRKDPFTRTKKVKTILVIASVTLMLASQGVAQPDQEHISKVDLAHESKVQVFDAQAVQSAGPPTVRMIYLVPADLAERPQYAAAIERAIRSLQVFYRNQMGDGKTFRLHSPVVETYKTAHPVAWYQTSRGSGGFWENVLADGFQVTGGGFNDPNNRWIFYIDSNQACNQSGAVAGGTSGVALLPGNDLLGVSGQEAVPVCPGDKPASSDWLCRWIGGLGHELGHAFNLPHPPGCDQTIAGVQCPSNALMYAGYASYPDTYLLPADKTALEANSFFTQIDLPADLPSCRRITLPGGPTLSPSPSSLTFMYNSGSAPPSQSLTLQSTGNQFLIAPLSRPGPVGLGVSPGRSSTPATISISANPNLTPGTYQGFVDVDVTGAANLVSVPVSLTVLPATPAFMRASIVNAASFWSGPVSPGEIITLFGTNFGPQKLVQATLDQNGLISNVLSDTRVLFDGVPAPLIYVVQGQVSAVVPYAVATSGTSKLQVEYKGVVSSPIDVPLAASAPALFTLSTGRGQGAILNQDASYNSASVPAARGSIVSMFGTGEGLIDPPGQDGQLVGTPLRHPILPVSIQIGGIEAEITYVGSAPGLVSGLFQLNVRIPLEVKSGSSIPVDLKIGSVSAQAGVTLAVQ